MKKTARIAGFLYFLQIPLGILGIVFIPKTLFIEGDLAATASNIIDHQDLFRLGILSAIVCALVTVATGYYISKVMKPVSPIKANLIVLFTLIVAPITILNELNNAGILIVLNHPNHFDTAQQQSMMELFIEMHKYGIQFAGLFFGLWLMPMGFLVIKSNYIPKVIGYFLLLTCLGYLVDFLFFTLNIEIGIVLSEFTWPGEIMMVFWLMIKGVKEKAFLEFNALSNSAQ